MIRTQIQLTEEQVEQLDQLADREGISRAELIRRFLDRELEAASLLNKDEAWDRAMDVVGSYASGTSSTSERHDDAFVNSNFK